MPKRKLTPAYIAAHIRRVIRDGGSAPHAAEVQWFFKEEVKSRGWYTGELRKLSVRFRRTLLREMGYDFLLKVADGLFAGRVLEEKVFAVFLLEKLTGEFGEHEFRLFESWLERVSSLGRSRCADALPDRAHDGGRSQTSGACLCVGPASEPVAAACGVRRAHPGNEEENVLPASGETVGRPATR